MKLTHLTGLILTFFLITLPEGYSAGSESDLGKGAELYHDNCSVCHGDRGNGQSWAMHTLNPPPKDFTSRDSKERLSEVKMFNAIKYGRPGTAMVAWGSRLNDEEIITIVKFIRKTFMGLEEDDHVHVHASHHESAEGNPAEGQKLYEQNCSACHGVNGDGRGPRAYFISPRPRNFTNSQEMVGIEDSSHLFTVTREGIVGTVMPAWGGVLSDEQIKDIVAYIEKAFLKKKPHEH